MAKHSEKIKVNIDSRRGILYIILFIVGMRIITQLLKQLKNQLLAGYISIAILLIMIVFTFKIINRLISEYEFTISGSRFVVTRITGRRSSRVVLNIHLKQIDYIVVKDRLKDKEKPDKKISKGYNYALIGLKRKKFVAFFNEGNERYSFTFQPSEKMKKFLLMELGDEKVIF